MSCGWLLSLDYPPLSCQRIPPRQPSRSLPQAWQRSHSLLCLRSGGETEQQITEKIRVQKAKTEQQITEKNQVQRAKSKQQITEKRQNINQKQNIGQLKIKMYRVTSRSQITLP